MKQTLKKGVVFLLSLAMTMPTAFLGNMTVFAADGAALHIKVTKPSGKITVEKAYDWTIDKTSSVDSLSLRTGESGTTNYTVTATKSELKYRYVVEGDITIENKGDSAATNVVVDAALRTVGGSVRHEAAGSAVTGGPADGVISAGQKYTYHYILYFNKDINPFIYGIFKVDAIVTGTNIDWMTPNASSPALAFKGLLDSVKNEQITVKDNNATPSNPADDLTHNFADTGTWTYSKTFNGSNPGTYVNTASATIKLYGADTVVSDTASVTVSKLNTAPKAVDDTATTNEDTAVDVSVLANDTDVDSDTLSVASVTQPSHGSAAINANGTVKYTPAANYNGTDTFTYTVSDGHGGSDTATVTITIAAVNDAPDAVNDAVNASEDAALDINVLANDTDAENDTLTITGITQPSHGTTAINPDSTVKYTPNANWNGTDTFTYSISDGNGGSDTATVTVTVAAVNDAPNAVNDLANTNEDTAVNINVVVNDTDIDGDTLTVSSVTQGAHGTVSINPDGKVKYLPNANWNGTDTFTYTISDGHGGTDTATVTVKVKAVNDAPDAVDDTVNINEDSTVNINVLANDTDVENNTLTIKSITQPSHGTTVVNPDKTIKYVPNANYNGTDTFTYTISDGKGGKDTATVTVNIAAVNDSPDAIDDTANTDEDTAVDIDVLANDTDVDNDTLTVTGFIQPSHGSVVVNADGTVKYTPAANWNGTDTFMYVISDGNGQSDIATVTVTVNAVNDAPKAEDDTATTDEDSAVKISVLANDTDVENDLLSVVDVTDPSHGTVVINADGTITYTPDANWFGTDVFTYTIMDTHEASSTATVTVTVKPVNDAPVALDDTATTSEDTLINIDVLTNDTDVDNDTLSIIDVTIPAHGKAVITTDGKISYTPDANYNGTDTFEYTVSDGKGGKDTAKVTVTIEAVNDAPKADDSSATTDEDKAISGKVTGSDADGDALTFKLDKAPEHGKVVLNSDGTYTYTPNTDYNGTDKFTFVANDGNADSTPATVTITIKAVEDIPKTGEETPYILYLIASLSIMAGAALLLIRHKKNN